MQKVCKQFWSKISKFFECFCVAKNSAKPHCSFSFGHCPKIFLLHSCGLVPLLHVANLNGNGSTTRRFVLDTQTPTTNWTVVLSINQQEKEGLFRMALANNFGRPRAGFFYSCDMDSTTLHYTTHRGGW